MGVLLVFYSNLTKELKGIAELPVNYAIALPTIMAQRLLLNIRRTLDYETSTNVRTMTTFHVDLYFASNVSDSQEEGYE